VSAVARELGVEPERGLSVEEARRRLPKAEESVKALAQMMKTIARVRRGGQALEIDAEELVPGDVVLMEAGNRVPADGRICVLKYLRSRWPRWWPTSPPSSGPASSASPEGSP
jgi:hypothetical protein